MPAQASESSADIGPSATADTEQQGQPDTEQQSQPIALSIDSACSAIDVSRTWLYEQIRLGRLASQKVAGKRFILRSELVRFVQDGGDES